jgi:hypothetical protein
MPVWGEAPGARHEFFSLRTVRMVLLKDKGTGYLSVSLLFLDTASTMAYNDNG